MISISITVNIDDNGKASVSVVPSAEQECVTDGLPEVAPVVHTDAAPVKLGKRKHEMKPCEKCGELKGKRSFRNEDGTHGDTCQKCLDSPSYRKNCARIAELRAAKEKKKQERAKQSIVEEGPAYDDTEKTPVEDAEPALVIIEPQADLPPPPIEDISTFAVRQLAPGEGLK